MKKQIISGNIRLIFLLIFFSQWTTVYCEKYDRREIFIPCDGDDNFISGTLTLPTNYTKLVVLVSSPITSDDKDYFGFFSDLSDYLSNNGIAVLRFESRSPDSVATTMHTQAKDVSAVVAFVKKQQEFQNIKLGLIGHSEGGCVTIIVASENKDIDFLVLLSTLGITGREYALGALKNGIARKYPALGPSKKLVDSITDQVVHNYTIHADIINQETDTNVIKQRMKNEYIQQQYEQDKPKIDFEAYCKQIYEKNLQPWMMAIFRYNPNDYLPKIQVPVLAICGSKDWKVNAKNNLKGLKTNLSAEGNKHVKTVIIKNINHNYEIVNDAKDNDFDIPNHLSNSQETYTFNPSVKAWQTIVDWVDDF